MITADSHAQTPTATNLETWLDQWRNRAAQRDPVAAIVTVIADAGILLANRLREFDPGLLDSGTSSADLAAYAHDVYRDALLRQAVGFIASGEREALQEVDPGSRFGVAIDPLDGSSNIATNLSIGTLFAVLEVSAAELFDTPPGSNLRAAGFLCFGPQTRLVLTCGEGVQTFLLEPGSGGFRLIAAAATIPSGRYEFAINMSNYRFWEADVRHFIDDCIAGEDGYFGHDFNMRWNASLVAEAFRILGRGGLFLYPGDSRPGYNRGRLRLLYEALPLAMIFEQGGGQAFDGLCRILDLRLEDLQQRVPLIAGSADRVREVLQYINGEAVESNRFPLFDQRSLFRN